MRIPKYRLHKPSGRAVFQYRPLFGKEPIYLPGAYGSDESRRAYQDCVAKVIAHQNEMAPIVHRPTRSSTVGELAAAFLDWAMIYHSEKEYDHFRAAVSHLLEKAEACRLTKFGPLKLKEVRQAMIEAGWSRGYINHQVNRLRLLFRWGAEHEWLDGSLLANLQAVASLRKGKAEARETEPVEPAAWEVAERLLPYLPPMLRAMLELQYLSGMRSDELTSMKPKYIVRSGDAWLYEPTKHKTAWRGKRKLIFLGPRSQEILKPYLPVDPDTFVFRPAAALAEHAAARASARKTKLYGKAKERKPRARRVSDRYDHHSYQQALIHGFRQWAKVASGANKTPKKPKELGIREWLSTLGITYFHPHQLRHTRATITRATYGIEGAQAQLGNTLDATEIYAEKSIALALRIARETG